MRTGASRRGREGTAALLLFVVLLAGLTGCNADSNTAPAQAGPTTALVDEVRALLARRAKAVRQADMSAFMATVSPARRRLVASQETYFTNLGELPLAAFRYVVPSDMVNDEDGELQAVVLLQMRIDEFDVAAVETPARYTFVRDAHGRLRIGSVRDREFEKEHDIELAPWDLGRITVVEGDGVLGVFDDDSVDAAYQIIDSVEDGIEKNSRTVPWRWSERVIVYALSDTRVLSSLDNLPGGDAERLDGVAFPVPAATDKSKLAGTRFMLHPRMLYRSGPLRDRLIRHELTHVVLGPRDDKVPTWLSEGIAEYVSVRPIARYERTISQASVEAARQHVDGLPSSEHFNGELSAANYGLAWYACEFIASTYGEQTLWRLFDEMRAGGGTSEKNQDAVLRRVLGIDSQELARDSGNQILATFD